MLASKTLLSVTLAVTFSSGVAVGTAIHRARPQPPGSSIDPTVVYASDLRALEEQGYDAAELAEAKQAYGEQLRGYDYWRIEAENNNAANLDKLDQKLLKRIAALKQRHAERTGAK